MRNVLSIDGKKPFKTIIIGAQCIIFATDATATVAVSIKNDSKIQDK